MNIKSKVKADISELLCRCFLKALKIKFRNTFFVNTGLQFFLPVLLLPDFVFPSVKFFLPVFARTD